MGPAASWMTCSTSTGDRGIYGYIPAIPFHANSNFSTYLRLSAGGAEIYGIRYESVGVVRAWIGGYIDRTTDVAMQFQDRRLSHGGNVTDTWIVYNGPYLGGPGSVINSPSGESTKLTFLKWLSGGYYTTVNPPTNVLQMGNVGDTSYNYHNELANLNIHYNPRLSRR